MPDDRLALTPHEHVVVRSATAGALEVEATYGPHGSPPPRHLHPAQDEHFEVLAGALTARVGDRERTLHRGDALEVARGSVHQMWNAGAEPASVLWRTVPAGRTLEWFRALDALQREGRVARNGMPGPLAIAVLLTEYRDVIEFVTPVPPALARGALALLAPLGRRRGYDARASDGSPAGA